MMTVQPAFHPRPDRQRGGFTLVELLVATGVFIIGFVAVYALFLSGLRFRKLADDLFKTATLASTLMTEVYLDSAHGDNPAAAQPALPSDYNGCGDPRHAENATAAPGTATAPKVPAVPLYGYQGCPGAVYRLTNTHGILGTNDQDRYATALVTTVLALCPGSLPPPDGKNPWNQVADEEVLERYMHLMQGDSIYPNYTNQPAQTTYYENELVARGIAMAYPAVIIRQPHWMAPAPNY